MNKTLGFLLIVFGVLLAVLGYMAHRLASTMAQPAFITGLGGGALCLVWGIRALTGCRGKALPILALIPINFVLLSQTVMVWMGGNADAAGQRPAALVITLMFCCSIAMLAGVAYAGVTFDGVPGSSAGRTGANPPAHAQTSVAREGRRS
jgi:hypothetical protein